MFETNEQILLTELLEQEEFSQKDIITLLSIEKEDELELLRKKAYSVMRASCGEKVFLRGLVEFSNICKNDCYYCGIRKGNDKIERYHLSKEEILEAALWSVKKGFGSMVLQSGERNDPEFIDFLIDVIINIKKITKTNSLPNGLGITLCVGEQTFDVYKRFFDAGAHRYLLRIETSSPELYKKIHPKNLKFENRIQCIRDLQKIGYQVGTGVMIGLPHQTIEDLADDILFFKNMNIDMIGMGPFLLHKETPLGIEYKNNTMDKEELFKLSLKMIAVTRLVLKDVNIASATALQAMYSMGREAGLKYGANVVMPMLTPSKRRKQYQLYEGKPCLDEFTSDCSDCIVQRIESTGRKVSKDIWGDSVHWLRKMKNGN